MFLNRMCLLALLAASAVAQGPKILIVTDMEGVGGVNSAEEQLLPGQRRYDESRKLLAGEVNAAVEGALNSHAAEVVIWDGHDGSRSLSIEDIHPRAQLIQGRPTPANYYLSDRLYDGIMFVGQHAMAGAKNGVLAHSQSFSVKKITLNGRAVGEIGQMAAIAGYFHIPVIMLAGDEAACAEIREIQPKAETVAVKRLAGKASSLSLSHRQGCDLIRSAAQRATGRIHEFKPWTIEGPVELRFEYHPKENESPRMAVYRGGGVLEAYEAWLGK